MVKSIAVRVYLNRFLVEVGHGPCKSIARLFITKLPGGVFPQVSVLGVSVSCCCLWCIVSMSVGIASLRHTCLAKSIFSTGVLGYVAGMGVPDVLD